MLILASTSAYRRTLLQRLGLPFECKPPGVDELALAMPDDLPQILAERLAREKASAVAARYPDATVIGSDQMAVIGSTVLGKPGTVDAACEQLARLSGQTHQLITALCVIQEEQVLLHTDITRLSMRRLTAEEIKRYVAADNPVDCAGAYKIEERGIALFEKLETADPTAITGLPLMALTSILRSLGWCVP